MRRFLFIPMVLIAVAAAANAAADDEAEFLYDPFPVLIILDAYSGEPAEYAYWKASYYDRVSPHDPWGSRDLVEEKNSWGPSISQWAFSAGTYSIVFRFYNNRNRLIKRVPATVYVDENGISGKVWVSDSRYGIYSYESWRDSYYPDISEPPAVSSLGQPWPQARLTARLSGSGPWEVTLNTNGNLPEGLIVSHEWDFNNDGVYLLNTGRTATQSRSLVKPGKYIFAVRITDSRGYTSTSTCEIDTRTEPPAESDQDSGW